MKNCTCDAFPFPHRPGSGKCQGEEEEGYDCEDCDFGGPGKVWTPECCFGVSDKDSA